jgi:hypothetical protein
MFNRLTLSWEWVIFILICIVVYGVGFQVRLSQVAVDGVLEIRFLLSGSEPRWWWWHDDEFGLAL